MINIIAAVGQNNELGKNNKLIWPLKKDLEFFREMTWDHDIIMGRRTFESLPKLLEHRNHIVLSNKNIDIEGVKTCNDVKALITDYKDKDAFVIGGAKVYKEFLEYTEKIFLTLIEAEDKNADSFFPKFDKREFKRIYLDEDVEDGILFRHVLYKRR